MEKVPYIDILPTHVIILKADAETQKNFVCMQKDGDNIKLTDIEVKTKKWDEINANEAEISVIEALEELGLKIIHVDNKVGEELLRKVKLFIEKEGKYENFSEPDQEFIQKKIEDVEEVNKKNLNVF